MSKKTILICVSVIAVLIAGVAVAVSVLYSGVRTGGSSTDDPRYDLMHAVPTDAVSVMRFSGMDALAGMMSDSSSPVSGLFRTGDSMPLASFVETLAASGSMPLASSSAVLSYHYLGSLMPLLVADAGRAAVEASGDAKRLLEAAESAGLYAEYVDCSEFSLNSRALNRKALVLISPSDLLVKSACRHLRGDVSVLDSEGFVKAAERIKGKELLFISGNGMEKLMDAVFAKSFRRHADFLGSLAGWFAFSAYSCGEDHLYMHGETSCDGDQEDFMTVFSSVPASVSEVSAILPSYALFAATVMSQDLSAYTSAYERYLETRDGTVKLKESREAMRMSTGMSPEEWNRALAIREVATASFFCGRSLEQVVLVRPENDAFRLLFKDEAVSEKNYVPRVHPYPYAGYAASLFGSLFSLKDESCFTFINGWIVSGSAAGVGEYVSGRALENVLAKYVGDAGLPDRLSARNTVFTSCFSLTESREVMEKIFNPDIADVLKASSAAVSYEPLVLSIRREKSSSGFELSLDRTVVTKSKAPVFERDTIVEVPKGPFKVKNSGTGRMNLFYQQDNLYLCLTEENGKGIWAVEFPSPICGRAGTVDYFANGKLQILFASGSKLYMLDRLGRPVNPFPLDLGKEILLGPDIYDFNGRRRYNVMVLHNDNTVDMYNLQGEKPEQWKGITASETIVGLPEPVRTGGRTFWVVRTSLQTLIFPFYGGEPLTRAEGDRMIRSDSKVTPGPDGTVTVLCYDGKERSVKL